MVIGTGILTVGLVKGLQVLSSSDLAPELAKLGKKLERYVPSVGELKRLANVEGVDGKGEFTDGTKGEASKKLTSTGKSNVLRGTFAGAAGRTEKILNEAKGRAVPDHVLVAAMKYITGTQKAGKGELGMEFYKRVVAIVAANTVQQPNGIFGSEEESGVANV